jgi:hypothetical protein
MHKFCKDRFSGDGILNVPESLMRALHKNDPEVMMKLSICIQKGKEVRKAIITLTKESNVEYIFKRLFDSGWLVVESNKIS